MNLGVILAIGESLSDFKKKGQLKRLVDYNIKKYATSFDKVYIFTYKNEKGFKLPKNCYLVPNKKSINRFIYSLSMPFLNFKEMNDCDVLRGLQLTGGLPALVSKICLGKKFIVNFGYDYSKFAKIENKMIQSILYKIIELPILKLADKVIVTSKEVQRGLAKKTNKEKLIFLPNGVDTNLFKKYPKKSTSYLTIMFVGRLEKQKNLENLIRALKNIPNSKAIFIGSGTQKAKLVKTAKENRVNLEMKKNINYEKLPQILSKTDVFALPSHIEGNPKILLEAMSCAKAVLGGDVEGIRELIKDNKNGLLTKTDEKSIYLNLKKLQDQNLREKIGKQARTFVLNNCEVNSLLTKEVNLLLMCGK